ncbi:MAG: type II toxin-antitoxin system RelE/ParE family toxin [Sedimentisphaerales bacterium]|nr:type II toxin-antitoxin system RelE/ParE family toxin [Sedimentisphaerales bacterium]
MAFQIIWTQTAVEDLKEIVQYIALDNPDAAARLAERIISCIENASILPFSNRLVPEKGEYFIRESILKPYRTIYHTDADREVIHVLRIWHAARGIPDID